MVVGFLIVMIENHGLSEKESNRCKYHNRDWKNAKQFAFHFFILIGVGNKGEARDARRFPAIPYEQAHCDTATATIGTSLICSRRAALRQDPRWRAATALPR
jgi:hypothetical protein